MTGRRLLSSLFLFFFLAAFNGYGQELKKAKIFPLNSSVESTPSEVQVDSTLAGGFLRVETINSDGSRSVSKQRVHPGGQPVSPSQRLTHIDSHLEAIALKWSHVSTDEELHAAAVASGWYASITAIKEELEEERALLLHQLGGDE